jgi:hypothetical protein
VGGNVLIAQVLIACCGVTAVFLTQDPRESWRRWACIFGLIAQPAWLIETIAARQYPIAVLTLLYTWCWWRGFRTHWLKGRAVR